MKSAELLVDAFNRVRENVHAAVQDLTPEQLAQRPGPDANSVAWLVWHLTRVQDDHVADAWETGQVWGTGDWVERFGLPFPAEDTGFGHSSADVAAVRVTSADLLTDYHDAVHARTVELVRKLRDDDLDRIVDRRFDPPVSLGTRLVSVIGDDLQHAGQAQYVRGLLGHPGRF